MPALAAGRPRGDGADQRAAAFLQAELRQRVGRHRRHADADHAARDLAGAQLRNQLAHAVDRNREADADVALLARVGVDRGVDADRLRRARSAAGRPSCRG